MRLPVLQHMASEDGQAVVEFALVASLLVFMLLGVMEFGNVMHAYLTVEYASREGARAGALGKPDAEIAGTVREALPETLQADQVETTITPSPSDRKPGESITVRVTYTRQIDIPGLAELIGRDSFTLAGETSMRIE